MSLSYELYKEGGLLNGRYQKLEDISEGSYGIVSLAKDITRAKLVAVKYIFKYQDDKSPTVESQSRSVTNITEMMDDDICEEAIHEINIHQKLGFHENIISLVDCFESFIILEYCPRGDLYEAIKADIGPTSTRDIVNVVLQLISAVEFAHSKSIYHRDIKPENILIADDFTIRLSDWGLASDTKLCTDFGVGSERYMAPELYDEKNLDCYDASKCDIWSVGICLLNIVFHKNPFSAANQSDKSFSYFACNREALFDIFSTMSEDLFSVLRHCLTLDPDNRDLELMKQELLKVQRLTFDEEFDMFEKDMSKSVGVKPITIREHRTAPRRKNNAKSFAIPTPSTHIADHFQDFKKEKFNRKDFFTPPSVNAHYLEKFGERKKYQPPHQRPMTPKRATSPARKLRKGSFNSYSSSAGKYIPPNLRSPNVMKSPLYEAVALDDMDSDDDLFVLEEHDTPRHSEVDLTQLGKGIGSLNLDPKDEMSDFSSAPSLIVPVPLHGQRNMASSNTVDNRRPITSQTKPESGSPDSHSDSSESNPKKYVPPHHRENYHSQWQPVVKKPSFWNHHNTNAHRVRRYSSQKREGVTSSSVPIKKTDWFPPSKVETYDDEIDDDEDFEKSEFYKTFIGRVGHPSNAVLGVHDGKNRLVHETINELNSVVMEN
jgi:serine/threonine protein kinase